MSTAVVPVSHGLRCCLDITRYIANAVRGKIKPPSETLFLLAGLYVSHDIDISTILEFSCRTELEFGWKLSHVSKSRHADTTISFHPLTFDEAILTLASRARRGTPIVSLS